jgi:hypothetical protein
MVLKAGLDGNQPAPSLLQRTGEVGTHNHRPDKCELRVRALLAIGDDSPYCTRFLGDLLQFDARIGRGAGTPVASERFVGFGLGLRFQEAVSKESLFATRI